MRAENAKSRANSAHVTDRMSQDRAFHCICELPRLTLKQHVGRPGGGCAPQSVLVTIKEACGLGLMMTALPTRGDLSYTPQALGMLWASAKHPLLGAQEHPDWLRNEYLWRLPNWGSVSHSHDCLTGRGRKGIFLNTCTP